MFVKNKRSTFLNFPASGRSTNPFEPLPRMRANVGSWLKRARAVRLQKFRVIRGSLRFGGGKKSTAESRELEKWLFAGEIRVILSSAKSFSFRITPTLSLVWWFSFWLDWCLRWVKEFRILSFFLSVSLPAVFLPLSLSFSSDFYIRIKHAFLRRIVSL